LESEIQKVLKVAYENRNGEHSHNIVSITDNKIDGCKAIFKKINRQKY